MNYADIKVCDVANGPGIRVSLFVSGCRHHCKNCFNPETWDFSYGTPFTLETLEYILELLKEDYYSGLTLLGGEPLEPENQPGILELLQRFKKQYPKKNVWCYTGFDFEKEIMGRMYPDNAVLQELLSYVDILVDGRFVEELKDLNLWFKGSSNQRTIQVAPSIQSSSLVLWEPPREPDDVKKN